MQFPSHSSPPPLAPVGGIPAYAPTVGGTVLSQARPSIRKLAARPSMVAYGAVLTLRCPIAGSSGLKTAESISAMEGGMANIATATTAVAAAPVAAASMAQSTAPMTPAPAPAPAPGPASTTEVGSPPEHAPIVGGPKLPPAPVNTHAIVRSREGCFAPGLRSCWMRQPRLSMSSQSTHLCACELPWTRRQAPSSRKRRNRLAIAPRWKRRTRPPGGSSLASLTGTRTRHSTALILS